ncbi:E3 ubiquitin ligase [Orbilia brochopaga]|uniref:E3 ubiquitin ligase n=1 Tax=Orbilia brochopaga TaxID=3140254 RepID=A0AAV9UF88_9PEZI
MDFPTRPVPSNSSLFATPAAIKPSTSAVAAVGATIGQPSLQSQTAASASASLKRASTEPADLLNASTSSTMPSLRSRSNKVAKNSQTSGESASSVSQLQNGDAKMVAAPAPIFDPRDDQIKDLLSDLAKLQKCVTCVVCQDLLFEPYSLACGHVFCYSCLKDWFRQKKTCPQCRAPVKLQPAPAYLIRGMIDTFVFRAELQSPHEEGQALRQQQAEALKLIETDKGSSKGLFGGSFAKKYANVVFDPEDGVARCPECNWEIEGRQCTNCGLRFHASELPGGDSDASDGSAFSEDESEPEDDDDDDSLSVSDQSDPDRDDVSTDVYREDSHDGWDVDYEADHRIALALQDEYHQEFMRHLGVNENWVDETFGADRASAAREAAREATRDYIQRSMSRNLSSPGRSLRHSSPYSRDSEDDSEDHTLDEDDSEMDDFIVRDTPERGPRRHNITQRTLRRHSGRSVGDLSDEDEDEDEEEDDDPVVARRTRGPSYYGRRGRLSRIISSDNEDDEEAAGLINNGYAQLDHDTTTGDDDDDDDSLGESEIGQILRPAGPLRANTMPATITATSSVSTRRSLQQVAASLARSATPPITRRRRRTVTFQVPEDADGENDSDARDEDGDLDMDRHSRAGSTSLASTSSNRTDASTRRTRSGGNHFSQDTPSVNDDESSDDSLPRQRSGRRRIGNTTSSSNLRRAATAHPNARNNNRASSSVDPVVHRLLRNFSAQRNESQLAQLGMSTGQPASLDLQELNEPIVISSSPVQTFFPGGNGSRQTSAAAAASTRESSVFSTLSSSSASREQNNASADSNSAGSVLSAPVQQMTASISNLSSEPNAWEMGAASFSNGNGTASTTQNGATARGSIRVRRSNATLRGQDIQRSGTPTNRQTSRTTRNQTQTPAEREEIRRRARDLLAVRQRDLEQRSASVTQATTAAATTAAATSRTTRSGQSSGSAMSLQQRIVNNRAEASSNGRDSATPTPQGQDSREDSAPPPRGVTRTDTGGSTGRRRGYQIGTGNNPGPLFVISDDDGH